MLVRQSEPPEDNIAPQVVFEILPPSNTLTELLDKSLFYARYGVQVVTPLSSDDAYRSETPPNSKYGRSNLSPSQDSYAHNDAQTNNPQQAHANTDAPDGLVLVSCDVFGGT